MSGWQWYDWCFFIGMGMVSVGGGIAIIGFAGMMKSLA